MNKDSVEIRRIQPHEWQQHRDIRLRMLTEAPEAFGSAADAERVFKDEDWQTWAQHRSSGASEAMFLAIHEGRWIGCLIGTAGDDGRTVRVWAMWVEPAWRGKEIGYLLLERLREWSTESGYSKMLLKVVVRNTSAKQLYERFGFEDTGERSGMRRDRSIEMMTMVLAIDPPMQFRIGSEESDA